MNQWNISTKLGFGFGLVLFLTCTLGYMAYSSLSSSSDSADTIAVTYMPALEQATTLDRSMRDSVLQVRLFLASGDPVAYANAQGLFKEMFALLQQMSDHATKYPRLVLLKAFAGNFTPYLQEYIKQAEANKISVEKQATALKELAVYGDAADDIVNEIIKQIAAGAAQVGENEADTVGLRIENLQRAENIRLSLLSVRRIVLLASPTSDMVKLAEAVTASKNINEELEALVGNVKLEEVKVLTSKADASIKKFHGHLLDLQKLWSEQIAVSQKRNDAYTAMNRMVTEFSVTELKATSTLATTISDSTTQDVNRVLMIIVAVLVIGILLSIVLTRMITGPVKRSVAFAQEIAAGNLEKTFDYFSKDEIGKLADALRGMVASLKQKIAEANDKSTMAEQKEHEANAAMKRAEEAAQQAVAARREGMLEAAGQLEGVVNIISSASEQLAAQIEQSGRGAEHSATRLTETATAMEEMNSTVLEVARNAGTASDVTSQTRTKAETGSSIVGEAVTSIQLVQRNSLTLKEDMQTLDRHTQDISQIMGVISDIADQTNLLALNAAIEAARAGDAGRGFAVVADEVRKLAEKTMASTTDVSRAIQAIQQSANKSMQQVDATVQNIEKATTLSTDSGTALAEIVNMVDRAADQVRAIATASEQQSATSDEINRSLSEVNNIAVESSHTMREATAAVHELAKQAQVLAKLVDTMKRG